MHFLDTKNYLIFLLPHQLKRKGKKKLLHPIPGDSSGISSDQRKDTEVNNKIPLPSSERTGE